jgi:hypothetical protein
MAAKQELFSRDRCLLSYKEVPRNQAIKLSALAPNCSEILSQSAIN